MFTTYFDASGHPDLPSAMFVSGFVSTAEKWIEFETAWLTLLDEYGIENPFHMTDFAVGSKQYASWKGDKAKRSAFMAKVIRVIRQHTHRDFSHGIYVPDFDRVMAEFKVPADAELGTLATPFSFCAVGAFVQMIGWARRYAKKHGTIGEGIELVYDRGDKDRGQFAEFMRENFKIDPIRRDKVKAVPLQAADVLAYEHAKMLKDLRGKTGRGARFSLLEMARQFPGANQWVYAQYPKLREYCVMQGFEKR